MPMLAYGNAGTQAMLDHWCPTVPPLQPHLINFSTWTALAGWTKQRRGQQHAIDYIHSPLQINCGSVSAATLSHF